MKDNSEYHVQIAALRDENEGLKATVEAMQKAMESAALKLRQHYGISEMRARMLAVLAEGGIWSDDRLMFRCSKRSEMVGTEAVGVHVHWLRKVLGRQAIINHWGDGHSLEPGTLATVRAVINGETADAD